MVGGVSSEANGNEEQAISGCLAAGVYLFWFRLFCSSPIGDTPRMKISNISVDISPIYPISVMFDTISAMIDISPIY